MNLLSNFAILFLVLSSLRISRGQDSDVEDNTPEMSNGDDSETEDNTPEVSNDDDSEMEDSQSQMPAGDSSKGDTKYLVSIYYSLESRDEKFRCAGALVTMQLVVTSWSCVKGLKRKSITVEAGSSKLRGREHVRTVDKIIWPVKVNMKRSRMNIAVVKVKTPFEKGPKIDSIPLCTSKLTAKSKMQVSGWRGPKKSLKTSLVNVIPRLQCTPRFKRVKIRVKHSMICAGGKKGIYYGGPGAPGVVEGKLCAIAVSKQQDETFPHLYTDLSNSKVRSFIRSAIRRN